MQHRKILHQNLLNMVVPPGIGIFYPDNLHFMGFADGVLFVIPLFYNLVLKMFFSVQFDGQHRKLPVALTLINYKIKTAGIE